MVEERCVDKEVVVPVIVLEGLLFSPCPDWCWSGLHVYLVSFWLDSTAEEMQ